MASDENEQRGIAKRRNVNDRPANAARREVRGDGMADDVANATRLSLNKFHVLDAPEILDEGLGRTFRIPPSRC
jgi:hypothetical protein